jgi:hypothetical protein
MWQPNIEIGRINMGVLLDGKYIWQAGDIVYCTLNELLHGPFIIHKMLENGSYLGHFVGGMALDFTTTYEVEPWELKLYPAMTLLPEQG